MPLIDVAAWFVGCCLHALGLRDTDDLEEQAEDHEQSENGRVTAKWMERPTAFALDADVRRRGLSHGNDPGNIPYRPFCSPHIKLACLSASLCNNSDI